MCILLFISPAVICLFAIHITWTDDANANILPNNDDVVNTNNIWILVLTLLLCYSWCMNGRARVCVCVSSDFWFSAEQLVFLTLQPHSSVNILGIFCASCAPCSERGVYECMECIINIHSNGNSNVNRCRWEFSSKQCETIENFDRSNLIAIAELVAVVQIILPGKEWEGENEIEGSRDRKGSFCLWSERR